jgi:hypothetical protein
MNLLIQKKETPEDKLSVRDLLFRYNWFVDYFTTLTCLVTKLMDNKAPEITNNRIHEKISLWFIKIIDSIY